MNDTHLAGAFSLVDGGPTYRIMMRLRLLERDRPKIHRRAVVLSLIAWVPLLVLSSMQRLAVGTAVSIPFLYDFAAYSRFLLAMPLLVFAEVMIGPRLAEAASHLISTGLVQKVDYPTFDDAARDAVRLRDSRVGEAVVLVSAYLGAFLLIWQFEGQGSTWRALVTGSGRRFTLAGWWYVLVSIPIFQFFLYRWLFRLFIWSRFLWRISKLNLGLVPAHPDRAGGLGFLGESHSAFAIITFAGGAVLSGIFCAEVIFEKVPIETLKIPIISMVVLIVILFEGPLLFFAPRLRKIKRKGLLDYGALATEYTRQFHDKWVNGNRPQDEPLVGSSDIQSLADLGNSFEIVHRMRIVPFDGRATIMLVLAFLIPMLPLLMTVMPMDEIVKTLLKLVA
jgi:hypothetical protein